jgi:predicted aspartyl protease
MNSWLLTFLERFNYSQHDEITVDIALLSNTSLVELDAKLDTGSKYCIFQPSVADKLDLNLLSGIPVRIRAAAGSFHAYGHEVTLAVGDLEWQTTVYFAEPENFPVNVVGRTGFLDHLCIGLVDYEQQLYLSPYEPA